MCNLNPENVDNVVRACVVLHNYLTKKTQCVSGLDPGNLDAADGHEIDVVALPGLQNLRNVGFTRASKDAIRYRQMFSQYFSNSGSVMWQNDVIEKGD